MLFKKKEKTGCDCIYCISEKFGKYFSLYLYGCLSSNIMIYAELKKALKNPSEEMTIFLSGLEYDIDSDMEWLLEDKRYVKYLKKTGLDKKLLKLEKEYSKALDILN